MKKLVAVLLPVVLGLAWESEPASTDAVAEAPAPVASVAAVPVGTIVVATNIGSAADIPTTVTELGSVTLEVPAAGSIVLVVTGHAIFFGDETIVEVGLSTTSTALDLHFTRVGRHDGTGTLRYVQSFRDVVVVPVSAGVHTFYATSFKESVFDTNIVTLDGVYLVATYYPEG